MNYVQKYYNEIFMAMLIDSLENGLISHDNEFQSYIENKEDISNYYVMDKSVISERLSTFYEDLTNVYNSINLELATGVDLDNLGNLIGIIRPQATYAMVELEFNKTSTSDTDILVNEGVLVETHQGIAYRTLEQIYIPVTESSCTVQAISVEPGVDYKVNPDTLNIITSEVNANLRVTNPKGSSGGTDTYNDEEYRALLSSWPLIYLKGSYEAYENYFSNFDGIDGFKIVPNWNGSGTVKIVLDPGTPFQLNTAYNEIRSSVAQVTEDIYLTSPESKLIDVYAIVNVDIDQINPYSLVEKESIKSRIISGIKTFIDGGTRQNGEYYPGLLLGEDFIPHKLGVFLDEEIYELKSIQFNYPEDYILIKDDEIGVSNTITIEMI